MVRLFLIPEEFRCPSRQWGKEETIRPKEYWAKNMLPSLVIHGRHETNPFTKSVNNTAPAKTHRECCYMKNESQGKWNPNSMELQSRVVSKTSFV